MRKRDREWINFIQDRFDDKMRDQSEAIKDLRVAVRELKAAQPEPPKEQVKLHVILRSGAGIIGHLSVDGWENRWRRRGEWLHLHSPGCDVRWEDVLYVQELERGPNLTEG